MNPLMQLLQTLRAHAAAGGGQGAAQGGIAGPGSFGPSGPTLGPQQGGGGGNFTQLVQQMIDLGTQAMRSAPDPVEASGMAKIVASLHDFEASAQKDRDAAMGVSPAVRAMRRSGAQG